MRITPPSLSQARASGTYALQQFAIPGFSVPIAATNWSNVSFAGGDAFGGRNTSSGAQNDTITFALPQTLQAGTWSFAVLHNAFTNRGIFTVETSVNNTDWTSQGTVDSYAASAATTRSTLTGLTIPAGTRYIRFTMATKNASSSSYFGAFQGVIGVRTGA